MSLFGKRIEAVTGNKETTYRCPYCKKDLEKAIVSHIQARVLLLAQQGIMNGPTDEKTASIIVDTAKNELLYKLGVECDCGKKVKPLKK